MADSEEHAHFRPSARAFFANWHTYDAPFAAKLRMAFRNNATKIRTRSSCCGHPGEPGC
jgi:hypothetical protein